MGDARGNCRPLDNGRRAQSNLPRWKRRPGAGTLLMDADRTRPGTQARGDSNAFGEQDDQVFVRDPPRHEPDMACVEDSSWGWETHGPLSIGVEIPARMLLRRFNQARVALEIHGGTWFQQAVALTWRSANRSARIPRPHPRLAVLSKRMGNDHSSEVGPLARGVAPTQVLVPTSTRFGKSMELPVAPPAQVSKHRTRHYSVGEFGGKCRCR